MKTRRSESRPSVVFRGDPTPGVRYSCGLTEYDEALLDGRLVARYWSATTGCIRPEMYVARDMSSFDHLPIHVFDLVLDGQALHDHWRWIKAWEEDDSSSNTRHVAIELAHELRPVTVQVHTSLDGTPFLTRWLQVTNTGDRPAALSAIFPWTGLLWYVRDYRESLPEGVEQAFTIGRFASSLALREGDFAWEALPNATTRLEGRNGRSGWGCPFFIICNEATGERLIGHIAWSGNWLAEFTCDQDPGSDDTYLFFRLGPTATPPMRVLAPGETIASPAVHLAHMHQDLDTCVQALHQHLRRSVLPPQPEGRGLLVQRNNWGNMATDMDEQALIREVDIAVDLGCEIFVIDAGWYGSEKNRWSHTLGDWDAGDWLPNDLHPVREYAREKGILFGLWMEPECIGSLSKVYREHPDWVLTRNGKPAMRRFLETGARFALDLTKPEVAEWVESEIVRVIERYDLDLFRLDYNINVYEGGQRVQDGFLENTLWRHYEAFYGIMDRIRQKFPDLIIENCSSGGGRNDLGMLSRSHHTWLSDRHQAPRGLKILNGMSMAIPPEMCSRIFGTHHWHQGLRGDIDFQLRVPLFGHYCISGFTPSPKDTGRAARDRIVHYVDLYKSFVRPMLPTCRVFHHTPALEGEEWCVLEYAAPDASRAMAGIFRIAGTGSNEYHFWPRGLAPETSYRVTFDNTGTVGQIKGQELIREGLFIQLDSPLTSELLLFESL